MVTTKNGRNMVKGTCSSCGSKKCTFVSAQDGGKYVIDELPNAKKIPRVRSAVVTTEDEKYWKEKSELKDKLNKKYGRDGGPRTLQITTKDSEYSKESKELKDKLKKKYGR